MYQNSLEMMPNVLNTDPILSVPNAWCTERKYNTVPNVHKMTNNDPSVPKTISVPTGLVYQSVYQVYQSAPNVPKLTRNDA